jgi:spermidine/putrescine transport system ATP-binding protein
MAIDPDLATETAEAADDIRHGDAAPAIELVGVAKQFASGEENVQAVERLDLTIRSGEFFSLLGPSGCGKTTTLRMIAGFETPSTGQILLYGEDVVRVPPNKRDVNMVFQSYALFPHMTVFDNVAFGLRRKGLDKETINRQVGKLLELVELEGRGKRRPRELSGGQQQRVALARALVNKPRALLLDEPLGALDLKLRQAMQLELKRIQREVGITFVYVTHDQGEALTMSDRMVVMRAGRIEQLGTPREVYERPSTRFVAGFIGTSNILTGRATRQVDGGAVIELGEGQRIVVPLRGRPTPQRLVLTVRPEKIALGRAEPEVDAPHRECRVKGVVEAVVYQGTFTSYEIRTTAGAQIAAHVQNVDQSTDLAEHGDTLWLSWACEHSYLLDDDGDLTAADTEEPAA